MADMQRPLRPQARSGAGQARRSAPQPKPTPWYVWAGLIAAVAAVVFLVWNLVGTKEEVKEEAPVAKKVDATSKVKSLEMQLPALRTEYRDVRQQLVAEKPGAKQKAEALKKKIDKWMEDWDSFFEPLRGPDDKLPPEYAGYGRTRAEINLLRLDLMKSSGN